MKRKAFEEDDDSTVATKKSKPNELYYCVQKHLASHLHYDFRIEHNGTLLSWAVPKGPSLDPKQKRLAMHVDDHETDYGDFEGILEKGYGAGIVLLWDRGTWKPENDDIDAALARGELNFSISGEKLHGKWKLFKMKGKRDQWLLMKRQDEFAKTGEIVEQKPLSVHGNDFGDVLGKYEVPKHWTIDKTDLGRPAKSGAAGKLLKEAIAKAKMIKRIIL